MIEQLAADNADDGAPVEGILLRYEALARDRPSINSFSRRQLEDCGLFSVFQVESLVDYRKAYGDILSAGELSLVDGFNSKLASTISIFFSFTSDSDIASPQEESHLQQEMTLKAKGSWTPERPSLTFKYSASKGRDLFFGMTVDHDAGERLVNGVMPDFVSAYASFSCRGMLRQLIVGDYTIRAGQGLVIWKAFGLSTFGPPASLSRNAQVLRPYASTDEANFLRGAAASFRLGRADVTAFVSANSLDARIVGDTTYTSIVDGGYHRTESKIAKRHTMREYLVGSHLEWESGHFRYGLTGLAYSYDKTNARTVKKYNRYQLYDGWWGDASADIYCFWRDCRIFAEAAVDYGGSPAALAGVIWSPSYNLEAGLLGRCYSRSYIATHAGASSALSSCSNQRGLDASARWILSSLCTLSCNVGYSYFPWSRYGIDGPSNAFKCRLSIVANISSSSSVDIPGSPSPSWRVNTIFPLGGRCRLNLRYAGNPHGNGGYMDLVWSPGRRLKITARYTVCDTRDWDSRLYFYESGVPGAFSIESWYGKRKGVYLLVKYSPFKCVDLWLKASDRNYAFFTRIFIPG